MRKKSKKFEKKHSNIGAMQEGIRREQSYFWANFLIEKGRGFWREWNMRGKN
jgi:hypothetical protein